MLSFWADLDWDALLGGAARHAVAPLLDRQLLTVAADVIPANQISRMNEANRVNTLRCLQLTAALVEILRLFQAEGIAALPYKGPILAAQAYGDLSMRQFDDIDIVVPQREMAKAQEIMLGLGYTAKFPGGFLARQFATPFLGNTNITARRVTRSWSFTPNSLSAIFR